MKVKILNPFKKKTTRRRKKSGSKVGLKANGTLKKGYRFAKGGRVVKSKKK